MHLLPHPPQLWMSFFSSTHAPLQHERPGPHGVGQVPPLLELDELDPVPMQHARQLLG